MRVLLRNGIIYANGPQPIRSMLTVDDRIVWIGDEQPEADLIVDLDGRIVVPGFVDAHIHSLAIGLETVDCHHPDPQAMLASFGPSDSIVIGHGWDDTSWPTQWFDVAQLDAAVGETEVYASRIDVHSAFVSSALLRHVPADLDGWSSTGVLTRAAHAYVRTLAFARLTSEQRIVAHRRTLELAASRGIVCMQEMSGPAVASRADAEALLSVTSADLPRVALWWGELHGFETASALGAHGIGGDLVIDGSVGSHTAAFCEPYADADHHGVLYQEFDALRSHIEVAVDRGIPAAFHAIGDAAVAQLLDAYSEVARRVGTARLRAARHRIEHCELVRDADLDRIVEFGLIASVQPLFDAAWGGPDGMYAQRLGTDRMQHMNRFATFLQHGIPLAAGTDAPVTPLDPWASVHAMQHHRTPGQGLTQRAAIAAHTRNGWRSIGVDDAGMLAPGWEASYAIWESDGSVPEPERTGARWSTDPRAGVPLLPDMRAARCVRTVRGGAVMFDALI